MWEGMDWIDLAQVRDMWQAFVNFGFCIVRVIWLAEELLTSQERLCCMHLISSLFQKRKYSRDIDLWHNCVTSCSLANVKSIIEILVQFLGRPVLYCLPHHALTFYFLQTKMEMLINKFVVISLYCFSCLCFNPLAAIFLLGWAVSSLWLQVVFWVSQTVDQNTSCTNYYFSVQRNLLHNVTYKGVFSCYMQKT